jgi:mandelate racemase
MTHPPLTLRGLRTRAVNVPLTPPVQTASGVVGSAPLVLVDLFTEEGVTGCSYVFCYTPLALQPTAQLIANLEALIKGDALAPLAIEQKLQQRFRLLGPQGLTGIAIAAIDMAAWDALAKACQLPLVNLLGGAARPIPAYASLRAMEAAAVAEEARRAAESGFTAVKIKVGLPDVQSEVEMIRAVRAVVGDTVELMVDYNQALSVPEAINRLRVLDEQGLCWIEEPTLADDFVGHAQIARQAKTPVQIGENWWGPHDMAKSVAANASDYLMPDVMKIGGVTGWLRGAALAEAHGLPLSSHLFPEISAHLLAVTPTAHRLEFLDLAGPILAEPARIENGHAVMRAAPGVGLEWREDAVQQYLVA